MECQQVKDLLSDYYDHELSSEVIADVELHLARCHACSTELAGFAELSATTRSLTHPVPPTHVWDGLQARLDAPPHESAAAQSQGRRTWTTQPAVRFALATAAFVLLAIGWFSFSTSGRHDEHAMAVVFGEYLRQFPRDPQAAQEILLTNYESRAVAADQAVHTVGYRPIVADGLPPGYTVASTHVMKMPCCTCVQCFCQRADGTAIAIFEHDDKEPNWFGDRPGRDAVCNGITCSLVTLADGLAVTWRQGARQISIIGARDMAEVNQLVAWFEERRRGRLE